MVSLPAGPANPGRRGRWLLALLAVATVLGLLLPGGARAGAYVTGSTLQSTPNLPYGCESRPDPDTAGQTLLPTGETTCSWWQSGGLPGTTFTSFAPSAAVIGARVKVGANPAPLRLEVRTSGPVCCSVRAASEVFQPEPNSVTTVPLDLRFTHSSPTPVIQTVVVSAVGPGTLPVHDLGAHGSSEASAPRVEFLFPGGASGPAGGIDGYEVLLQLLVCQDAPFTFPEVDPASWGLGACPTGLDPLPTTQPAPPAESPEPPKSAPAKASIERARRHVTWHHHREYVRLHCSGTVDCEGKVRLRRDGQDTLLGHTTTFEIKAGHTRSIKLRRTSEARRQQRLRQKTAAYAVVLLDDQPAEKLRLTLMR